LSKPETHQRLCRLEMIAASIAGFLALALCVRAAQDPQDTTKQSGTVIRSNSRLVLLDVVVTDRAGNPVTGLTKDDFTVLEDGVRQQIATFETPEMHFDNNLQKNGSLSTVAHNGSTENPANATRPETILVLDNRSTGSEDASFGWQMLIKYLQHQPATLPEPTALLVLNKRRLERIAAPTQDTAQLLAKARKIELELPSHSMENGVQGAADSMLASLLALDEIALSTANRHTRKNIIWVGTGFPMLSAYQIDRVDRDNFLSYIRYTANWLQETRSTIYTIDPKGLQVVEPGYLSQVGSTLVGQTGSLPQGELIFESLAPTSGGKIYRNRNDVDVAIANAVETGSTYYTISYSPQNLDFDGKFRKIRIVVGRPETIATTQEGYYAVDEGFGTTKGSLDFALSRAVTSPLPFASVEFDAVGKVLLAPPPSARFSVSVDRSSISWVPQPNGDQRGELTLVTAEVSKNQGILAYKVKELEIVLPKNKFENSTDTRALFYVTTPLPPKTDHIRFVLRDAASGRLGTFDVSRQALGQQIAEARISRPEFSEISEQ
jgi:VWFA-related protein